MAILNHGSTIRTTDGGQSTATIVTSANIGSFGIATNSTYYIGTTQNVFNRASGAQTLTGVSIDGNAANITAYTINQNVGTGNTPSFAGIVSSAVTNYAFLQTTDTNNFWITPGNNNWGLYFETSAGGLLGGTGDSNRLGFVGAGSARFYVDLNNGNGWFGGSLTANTDSRAPIFYDSANTSYYLDPNNTGTSMVVAGKIFAAKGNFSDASGSGAVLEAYNTVATNATTAIIRQTTAGGNGNQDIGLLVDIQGAGDTDRIANFRYYDGSTYTSRMAIMRGGNVGIGTTSPGYTLTVNGTIAYTPSAGNPVFIGNDGTYGTSGTGRYVALGFGGLANSANKIFAHNMGEDGLYICSATSRSIFFRAGGGATDHVVITSGGNLGVATLSADTNLQVVGHVHVGNQTTFENAGGWNKTIYLDGLVHARMRILGSAYASGKNSATETNIWVDNSVAPYSGLTTNAGSFTINAGFTTLTNSARSPIFYDSDNTAYYVDAASTSVINALSLTVLNNINAANGVWHNSAEGKGRFYFGSNSHTYFKTAADFIFRNNSDIGVVTIDSVGNLRTSTSGDNFASYSLHVGGTGFATADFRSPIFYDSANTAYYLDPANTGTSLVIAGKIGSGVTSPEYELDFGLLNEVTSTDTIRFNSYNGPTGGGSGAGTATGGGTTIGGGITWKSNYTGYTKRSAGIMQIAEGNYFRAGLAFYTNNVTDQTTDWTEAMRISSNSYIGIGTTDFSYTINDNSRVVGSNTNNRLFVSGSIQLLGNNDAIVFGRGTSTFLTDEELGFGWGGGWYMTDETYLRVRNNKLLYTTGEIWASAFKDSNNTAYYLDPASTSNLVGLTVANTITGSVSGNAATATNVTWTGITQSTRTNYDLTFQPPTSGYAGFSFNTTGGVAGSGGYFLIRGTSDNDVYTAEGITLVADAGWLTLAQRTTASRGVRIMTGTSSSERLKITTAGDIQFVNGNSFTYNSNVVLHAGNYGGYSVFSGSVSSGGNITATGYIFTSTYLQTGGNLIYPSGYGATQRLEVSNSANTTWIDGLTIAPGGIVTAPYEMRSPIFYDSNDTAYYLDAANTTLSLKTRSSIVINNASAPNNLAMLNIGYSGGGETRAIDIQGSWSGGENKSITFTHSSGSTNIVAQINAQHNGPGSKLRWGKLHHSGDSSTYTMELISESTTSAYLTVAGSVRAPIFYDSNDTGYYCDPASTSRLNTLSVGTGAILINGAAIATDRNLKIKGATSTGVGIVLYDGSDNFRCQIYGETSNYGFLDSLWGGWDIKKTIGGNLNLNNNTTYYLNPASTTNLNNLTVAGTMTFGTLAYVTESRRSKNSSNVDIETVTGLVSPSGPTFLEIRGFCPPTMFRTTGDRPAPYGLGFGNGAESGGIMPIGAGDNLQEIMLYGSNTGPTTFTFKRQNWEGSTYDPSYSNNYSASVFSINTGTGVVTASTDIRSPILYDSNDTAYYLDPRSTSVLSGLKLNGIDNEAAGTGSDAILWINKPNNNDWGIRVSGNLEYLLKLEGATSHTYNIQGLANGSEFWRCGTDLLYHNSNIRAPIFYDSANTAYYLDPANTGTSLLVAGKVGIGTTSPTYKLQIGTVGSLDDSIRIGTYQVAKNTRQYIGNTRDDSGLFESAGNGDTPSTVLGGVAGIRIVNTEGTLYAPQADNSVQLLTHIYNGGSRVALHANYNGNVGIGTTSPSQTLHVVGTGFASTDFRAPIFYDSDNTSYYLNPAGNSQVVSIYANDWFRAQGNTGLYFQDKGYGITSAGAASNSYGNASTYGSGLNGWQGWGIGSRHCMMSTGGDNFGIHDNTRSWLYYWDGTYHNFQYGYLQSASSVRAPLFYDSDNTAYYLDPNSTTSLRTVGSWRSDSSTWDGEFSGKIQYHSNHWYFQAAGSWLFRNSAGSNVAEIDNSGNINGVGGFLSGNLQIRNGDPTITFRDTDHRTGFIHVNSNIFYVLTGGTDVAKGSWSQVANSRWPMELNLSNNNATFGGDVNAITLTAPIFYDANNTAYYIDAASTSNLNGLNIVDGNLELYKSQTVDMSNTTTYSTSNYYPVTISVPTEGCIIQIQNNLNSNVPSWATHGSGFTLNLRWRTNGSGWGTTEIRRYIEQYHERFANQTICGGITQMTNSSLEVVWLRGGGQYYFKFSRNLSATAQAVAYTINSQTVTPGSTAQNTIWNAYSGGWQLYNDQTISTSNMYTPVLYDYNNSAYYVDPASTSNLVGLTVANTITGSITGNAGGSSASCTGNAATATILQTARNINGTSFNGSAAITTATWGTARTLTIGSTGKSVDGSANVSWSLAELGAAATNQTMFIGTTSVAINRASASQTLTGVSIDGSSASCTGNAVTSTSTNEIILTGLNNGTVSINNPRTTVYRNENGLGAALAYAPVLHVGGGDTMWQVQGTYGSTGNGTFYFRQGYQGVFGNWLTMLSSANYNSYSPTLTGTGASGSWGISVTGSSASCTGNSATTTLATKATRANGNFYIDDNYGNTVVGLYSANRYQGVFAMGDSYKLAADGTTTGTLYGIAWSHPNAGGVAANLNTHGALILENGAFLAALSGSIRSRDDMRSPIFYDSNNTSYYIDPVSTSNLNAITAIGNITAAQYYTGGWFRNNSSGNGLYNEATGEHFYSDAADTWNIASSATTQALRLRTGGYNGTIRGYFYANNSNDVGLLNQDGNWRIRVVGGDYTLFSGSSIRAPLFYDSDNTAYYVDPASTSILNLVRTRNTFGERVAVTSASSTTVDTQYNVTELTMSASITTLTLSNIQASAIVHMWTIVTVGNGTTYSITWPAAIKWPGGTAPTITATNTKRDIYQFVTYDGGTTIYAIIVGQNL